MPLPLGYMGTLVRADRVELSGPKLPIYSRAPRRTGLHTHIGGLAMSDVAKPFYIWE